MLRFLTSGESHGPMLVAILDGIPAGLPLNIDEINEEMGRRQQGYGRGARQKIEQDKAEITGGVRHGITSGAPLGITVTNRDWDNWQHVMSVLDVDRLQPEVKEQLAKKAIARFRPGHADLAGTLKFRQRDIRDVLERASARETAARVAVGAICHQLLKELGIRSVAHVIAVGAVSGKDGSAYQDLDELEKAVLGSEMFCADAQAGEKMKETIKSAWQNGDSLGGLVEVVCDGLPVGLGSYTQWDEKLDGQLAQAVMSVQAIKAVEIGDGVANSRQPGSAVHDALYPAEPNGTLPFSRKTNRAGGIEGGMTNGSRLVVRAYMKPIPTLRKGLPSLSFPGYQAEVAHYERSDVCAVPAASIVVKAMVSFVLARSLLQKFGGDTLQDTKSALERYRQDCARQGRTLEAVAATSAAPEMELE
jgi:chorismate synthase